jgi:hypothetical protein
MQQSQESTLVDQQEASPTQSQLLLYTDYEQQGEAWVTIAGSPSPG